MCCLGKIFRGEHHKSNIYFAMKKSELGISYRKSSFNVLTKEIAARVILEWLEHCGIENTNASTLILDVRDGLLRDQLKSLKQDLILE